MKIDYEQLRVRKLNPAEHIASFDCGDEDLNSFILEEAPLYRKALLAVTYYFSLANDKVSLSDFESKTEFNRFRKHRFVNEKRLKSYPAGKLCRLAVDNVAKSLHLGSYLVKFIKSYFVTDNKTVCRFLTVDAYADAIPFYLKNGFIPLNEDDAGQATRLLFFDLNDIDETE